MGSYASPEKTLRAQTLSSGERTSQVVLQYQYKNLSMYVGAYYLFNKVGYRWEEKSLSNVHPTTTLVRIKDNSNMLVLGASYSLNFGKRLKKLSKTMNNADSSDILTVQ